MFDDIFQYKKVVINTLRSYGFKQENTRFTYTTDIYNHEFILTVYITNNETVDTALIEKATGEPYTLYKTKATGTFIGNIRSEIEDILVDIAEQCYESVIFKSRQSKILINYVRNTYGDELEFLWERFPDNAVWRRKDNRKWYGAILTVQGKKIGLNTDDIMEILDLRMSKACSEEILKKDYYYPGWHMNKKSWYTVVLNDSLSDYELFLRINESYDLAK